MRLLVETADGKTRSLSADKVLVTVGRSPATEGWGLEELDARHGRRFIKIDDHCRTSMRGVFAIGDVTGEPMLAHRAMAQGEMVAEIVAGHKRALGSSASIPAVCFTDPEIVAAGLSPEERGQGGRELHRRAFPVRANGRAMTLEWRRRFRARRRPRRQPCAARASRRSGRASRNLPPPSRWRWRWARGWKTSPATIHAHPTLGEALQEAALKALGQAIHI